MYTKAYYVVYLLIGIAGFLCRNNLRQDKRAIFSKPERSNVISALIFSFMITIANYDIPSNAIDAIASTLNQSSQVDNMRGNLSAISLFYSCIIMPLLFLGGIYIFYYILSFITHRVAFYNLKTYTGKKDPLRIFLCLFLLISLVYCLIMILCYFPGISSGDSRRQLEQALNGNYSGNHPLYHTLLIKFFVLLGKGLFGSLNAGVAMYSIFSIMLIAAAFAFASVTIYQMNISKKIVFCLTMFYLMLPFNITYSFTMWKDIPFTASVLFFTVSVFRFLQKVGEKQILNKIISLTSGIGICLFRNNGLLAFAVTLLIMWLWFRKEHRKMCISLVYVFIVSLLLQYPLKSAIEVEPMWAIEPLSIPFQQMARTVVDNDDLSKEQLQLLSELFDVENVKEIYEPYIFDPIKMNIIHHGGQDYYLEHKAEYFKLYFQLGLSHPKSYLAAWIDQTKGYWNAGYTYWRFTFTSSTDEIGTRRVVLCKPLQKAVYSYIKLFEYTDILKPFISIGLHTWLMILVAFVGYRKKDKSKIFLAVPSLSIVFFLLLGTPVFAEFRYAYPLFCCLPFAALALIAGKPSETENK